MICSMTGYAACARPVEGGSVQLEIKSVNSRYLDFHFRVGEELRASELPLRELFASQIKRGKVECRLSFQTQQQRSDSLQLNVDLLAALSQLGEAVRARLPDAAPLSVNEILRWPGMFGEQRIDFAALVPEVLATAREALTEFTASRAREGEKLANVLRDRVADMRAIVAEVAPRIPQAQAA
ncbi:YicC/YloC family endoribonuclease, partial [Azonexus sp.]|uniref:YicC/YloC family endoribonuclease n=1 Tax=Azonexus sp. TaxID=1872668 RepID=UPI0039E46380